jgi:hypothetical protein
LGLATEDDIDLWLTEMEIETLEKKGTGKWNFIQHAGGSNIQVSIMYIKTHDTEPPMIGIGCLFLEPPKKNHLGLYKHLLELHTASEETKFALLASGAIMLITHRCAMDLDPSELKDMINKIVSMYDRFHDSCLSIVT